MKESTVTETILNNSGKVMPAARIGIWIRSATGDPVHIARQESEGRAYAAGQGCPVVEIYRLERVAGKNVGHHPEAKRMLADICGGHVNTLVVVNLARLSRTSKELLELVKAFEKHHAVLISLQESINTGDPLGCVFVRIIAGMAKMETEEISTRIKQGLHDARLKKRNLNREPNANS